MTPTESREPRCGTCCGTGEICSYCYRGDEHALCDPGPCPDCEGDGDAECRHDDGSWCEKCRPEQTASATNRGNETTQGSPDPRGATPRVVKSRSQAKRLTAQTGIEHVAAEDAGATGGDDVLPPLTETERRLYDEVRAGLPDEFVGFLLALAECIRVGHAEYGRVRAKLEDAERQRDEANEEQLRAASRAVERERGYKAALEVTSQGFVAAKKERDAARERVRVLEDALRLTGHECEPIADFSAHMEGDREWWVGRLTKPIEGYEQERYCFHVTTPLKGEIVFGFNDADLDFLVATVYAATGKHQNPDWTARIAEGAKKRARTALDHGDTEDA